MKRAIPFAFLLVFAFVSATFAATDSDGPKVFRYAYHFADLELLDVHKHTTTDVMQAANPIGEALVRIDSKGVIHPLLLEALPEMSADGTLFTFKLKKGVKFHDGTELRASDVEFTFNRIFDPKTQNLNTWLCDMIKGAPEMLEGKAQTLEGFKVIDDYTFTIELGEPYAPFLAVLGCEQMMIYPKKACEEAGSNWGLTTFVGTGPFELAEFSGKEVMHAKRFEGYHGEPAKIDELFIYVMDQSTALMEYEAGNLDMVRVDNDVVAPYKTEEFAKNLVRVDLMGIIAMNMNVNMPPLDNVKVREAVSYAIDRQGLLRSFLDGNGTATNCMIPPGIAAHVDRPYEYNPEKVKSLLAEAGYPDGITLEAYVSETQEVAKVAVVLQEQFKASNVTLNVNRVDQGTYVDMRRAGQVQVPFLTWFKDISDPDNFTYTFYHSTSSQLFSSNWKDAKTDEMLARGRASMGAEREKIYLELEKYLVDEQRIVAPLYNPVFYYLVADGVSGVIYDNSLLRFYEVEISK
ncbi:MAG: ABC transporter substrate-binding protein [Synergistaceae bacterium]|jgi:ABC-type transport system substrate-binding protein|nr:ABC transporter substrate-binding protein [Synergistaceae bacterium]